MIVETREKVKHGKTSDWTKRKRDTTTTHPQRRRTRNGPEKNPDRPPPELQKGGPTSRKVMGAGCDWAIGKRITRHELSTKKMEIIRHKHLYNLQEAHKRNKMKESWSRSRRREGSNRHDREGVANQVHFPPSLPPPGERQNESLWQSQNILLQSSRVRGKNIHSRSAPGTSVVSYRDGEQQRILDSVTTQPHVK